MSTYDSSIATSTDPSTSAMTAPSTTNPSRSGHITPTYSDDISLPPVSLRFDMAYVKQPSESTLGRTTLQGRTVISLAGPTEAGLDAAERSRLYGAAFDRIKSNTIERYGMSLDDYYQTATLSDVREIDSLACQLAANEVYGGLNMRWPVRVVTAMHPMDEVGWEEYLRRGLPCRSPWRTTDSSDDDWESE